MTIKKYRFFVAYIIGFIIFVASSVFTITTQFNWFTLLLTTSILIFVIHIILVQKREKKILEDVLKQVSNILKRSIYNNGSNHVDETIIKQMNDAIVHSFAFVKAISEGNNSATFPGLTSELQKVNDSTLAGELTKMQEKMTEISRRESERNWITSGIAKFSELFRNQNVHLQEILDHFLRDFCKYLDANQASIFLWSEESQTLKLMACYAYERKKFFTKEIAPGEGLVGQIYLEKESVYLKKVPEDYIKITSGLGQAPPRIIYLAPLLCNDQIEGVIEIASFKELPEYKRNFIDKIAEIIASAVATIKINETTRELLGESKSKEEQLKAQEEELRQNLEELQATQEAMQRKASEAYEQQAKLTAILDSAVDPIVTINDLGIIETVNKATCRLFGYEENELVGVNVKIIVPDSHHSNHDQYLVSYKNTSIKKIIGKTRLVNGIRRDKTTFPIEIAVNEADVGGRIIFTAILRDISERVRLENEQAQYVEELTIQGENLRQNMEELRATQEQVDEQLKETSRLNREMDARIAVLNETTILSESDLFGTITFVNKKFCEVSQYSMDELVGNPHNIVRHPDMPRGVFELMWTTIKAGKIFRGIVKNKKKDGTPYYVDAVISPVLDENGLPMKYIGARYVIENSELAEQMLQRQNEMITSR